jgi:hypothetical protein
MRLFRRAPKLAAEFRPTRAVARELKREIELAGQLVLRNEGRETELADLALVFIGGGTRRIDIALPAAWQGRLRVPAGGALREDVAWTVALAAPMRAPEGEIQVVTTEGGKLEPLATTPRFPLANE